ncbi:Methyl-accepting chemotaxis protein PctB [compost metagenome]
MVEVFAVVADEVRNLAKRTQDSVEQSRGVIQKIQTGIQTVVTTMQIVIPKPRAAPGKFRNRP